MSPDRSEQGRYWPTHAQLVVVWGERDMAAQWLEVVRELHEAARDLIDLWDDEPFTRTPGLADAVERVRHTLWQVRQWDAEERT